MHLFFAIFLPFVSFFMIKRPIAGMISFVMQFFIIGWIPAALWAVHSLSQFQTDQKIMRNNEAHTNT